MPEADDTVPSRDTRSDAAAKSVLARIRALAKPLPADWRFDREDANARCASTEPSTGPTQSKEDSPVRQ